MEPIHPLVPALLSGCLFACLFSACAEPPVPDPPDRHATVVRRYQPDGDAIANPERGFYLGGAHCESQVFDIAMLRDFRSREGVTLAICIFQLGAFRTRDIDEATLRFFDAQMARIRQAGFKAIVRFTYGDTADDDADAERIAAHLEQLAPRLRRNRDVLLVMQEGLVGAWGEGALSRRYGDTNRLTPPQREQRALLRGLILAAVPAGRMLQVRTPFLKQLSTEAGRVRTGHYNDCFLRGPTDAGTYRDPVREFRMLAAETARVPMGGETCGPAPPRTDCPTALDELARFHWSYLNLTYHPAVLAGWRRQGCFGEVERRLGYRLRLELGRYPAAVPAGAPLPIRLLLHNDGWAAPFNPRAVRLVLQSVDSGAPHVIPLDADPRDWQPGETIVVDEAPRLPAHLAPGAYRLYLALPDPEPSLAARPDYAIRLANAGLWHARTGWNDLQVRIDVLPAR